MSSKKDFIVKNGFRAGGNLIVDSDGNFSAVSTLFTRQSTDNLPEGTVNLYYDSARTETTARNALSATGDLNYDAGTGVFSFSAAQTYLKANFDSDFGTKTTDDLTEGTTNFYYDSVKADSDARHAISGGTNITYDPATGIINGVSSYTLPEATSTVRGGIELFSDTDNPTAANAVTSDAGRTYGLQLNAAGQGVVNVPWVAHPTFTPYSAAALSGATVFSDFDVSTEGHVTNVTTRELTAADIGATATGHTHVAANITDFTTAVRGLLSGTGNISYNSGTGEISTIASPTFTDLTVDGDLFVNGTTTTVNSESLSVRDPLIHLADSNETSDTVDIGFVGHYSPDGGTTRQHAGFFRDATDGQFYVFSEYIGNLDSAPASVVDRGDGSFKLAALNALTISGQYLGFDSDFGVKTTTDLTEGTNLYFTDARARAALTGGTGVSVSGGGVISIGQAVGTTDAVQFGSVNVDGAHLVDTLTTATSSTATVAISTKAAATYRSARYTVQATNTTNSTYHAAEILLIHDGTTAYITEYGTIYTGVELATYTADINAGNIRLLATPATANNITFKVVEHMIAV